MRNIRSQARGSIVEVTDSGETRVRPVETPSYADNRTAPRLKTLVTALVTAPALGQMDARPVTCLDLSASGMVFAFRRPMRPHTPVIVTLRLSDRSIDSEATVVRCERTRRPGIWRVAVKFSELSDADQRRIEDYVAEESDNRFGW